MDTLNRRKLSVHYIVARDGTVYYTCDESKRASHAGVGKWAKYFNLNDVSIGIEIVNSGAESFPVDQVKNCSLKYFRVISGRDCVKNWKPWEN